MGVHGEIKNFVVTVLVMRYFFIWLGVPRARVDCCDPTAVSRFNNVNRLSKPYGGHAVQWKKRKCSYVVLDTSVERFLWMRCAKTLGCQGFEKRRQTRLVCRGFSKTLARKGLVQIAIKNHSIEMIHTCSSG